MKIMQHRHDVVCSSQYTTTTTANNTNTNRSILSGHMSLNMYTGLKQYELTVC